MNWRRAVATAGFLLLTGCSTHGLVSERVRLPNGQHVICVRDRKHGFASYAPSCDWGHTR